MSLVQGLYDHKFKKNLICFRGIIYAPYPKAPGAISIPEVFLNDLYTILNKITISRLLSDPFWEKKTWMGVVTLLSLLTLKMDSSTF